MDNNAKLGFTFQAMVCNKYDSGGAWYLYDLSAGDRYYPNDDRVFGDKRLER